MSTTTETTKEPIHIDVDAIVAPNGAPIIATLESLSGAAIINAVRIGPGGLVSPEYAGETKVYWDEQKTSRTADGAIIYLCESGQEWTLHATESGAVEVRPANPPKKRYRAVCKYCGSTNVFADTSASWNDERQEWEMGELYDKGDYCGDCESTGRVIDMREIEQ